MLAHKALRHLLAQIVVYHDTLARGSIRPLSTQIHTQPHVVFLFKPTGFVLLIPESTGSFIEWPKPISGHEALTLLKQAQPLMDAAQALQDALVSYQSLLNQCQHRKSNLLFLRVHLHSLPEETLFSGALCGHSLGPDTGHASLETWNTLLDQRTALLVKHKADTGADLWYVESGTGRHTMSSKVRADTPQAAKDIHYALSHSQGFDTIETAPVHLFKEYIPDAS